MEGNNLCSDVCYDAQVVHSCLLVLAEDSPLKEEHNLYPEDLHGHQICVGCSHQLGWGEGTLWTEGHKQCLKVHYGG